MDMTSKGSPAAVARQALHETSQEDTTLLKAINGQTYRVVTPKLTQASPFFQALFETTGKQIGCVELGCGSKILQIYLNVLDLTTPVQIRDGSIDPKTGILNILESDVPQLIELAEKYDTRIVLERIALALHRNDRISSASAWNVFVFASQLDDPSLAKKAILAMGNETWIIDDWQVNRIKSLTIKYVVAFRNAVNTFNDKHSRYQSGRRNLSESELSSIAKDFQVS